MNNSLIAQRYASGLSAAIPESAELDGALDKLTALADLIEQFPVLPQVLEHPAIDIGVRKRILDDVLRVEEISTPVAQLSHLLLERRRIVLLGDVATAFAELVDERLNRVTATITSAAPLTEEQTARLRESLGRYSGRTVRLECKVDPDLIGGIVAMIGGEAIDGSLYTRLARLKEALIAQEM